MFSLGPKVVLMSAVRGQLTKDGVPLSGVTLVQETQYSFIKKSYRQKSTTDAEGFFSFEAQTHKASALSFLPHQPVIPQAIYAEIDGERIRLWWLSKSDYDNGSETNGVPMVLNLDIESEESPIKWRDTHSTGFMRGSFADEMYDFERAYFETLEANEEAIKSLVQKEIDRGFFHYTMRFHIAGKEAARQEGDTKADTFTDFEYEHVNMNARKRCIEFWVTYNFIAHYAGVAHTFSGETKNCTYHMKTGRIKVPEMEGPLKEGISNLYRGTKQAREEELRQDPLYELFD